MVGVYRVFRVTVSVVVCGAVAMLVGSIALDAAADRGILPGLPETDWNPSTIAESIPGFWPSLLFATGLALGMAVESNALRRRSRARRRRLLDIFYDPNDHRYVHREFPHGGLQSVTHFKVGIHNTAGDRSLHDVVVSAGRNAFVKTVIEPAWGSRTRHIKSIAPNATEFVEFLALPGDPGSQPEGDKVRRFVIRARASDTRGISAKFEFSARAHPMIRRLV